MARKRSSKRQSDIGIRDPETRRVAKIRWTRFSWLIIVLVVILIGYVPFTILSRRNVRESALFQAREAGERGQVDLALRHLNQYLAKNPDDVAALDLKAKYLSEVPLPWDQLIDAANTLVHLISLDPKGPGRDENRRKLAEFYIRYSDELKRYAETGSDPDLERQQSRYIAAASIVNQLLDEAKKGNYKDAAAHRLLAKAYEGQISEIRGRSPILNGKTKAAGTNSVSEQEIEDLRLRAIKNYKIAIDLDPHDLESPARLAFLYMTWAKDQVGANAILDAMLQANPKSVAAMMARYRVFAFSNQPERARAELGLILEIAPENFEVRIEAASAALGKKEYAEARRHLDAIAKERQEDLEVKILRGYIEFAQEHPDDAIDQWRRGLQIVGGGNQDLTWKLAWNLVQRGRLIEADPLREQYRRLTKGVKDGKGLYLDALFDMGYGRLYDARKKLDKIKDTVKPGLRPDVLISLGRCCDMMGDVEAALGAYRNAATAAPTSVGPRLAIARLLQKRSPNEAVAEIDRARQDSPDELSLLLEAIRLRINILSTRPAGDPKLSQQLEELFARAQRVAPNTPSLLSYRAEFLAVTGKLDKAVDSLAEALKGNARTVADVWITLAQGLERLNRRKEAIEALDKASLAENAGDHAKLRVAKARLLARWGKGQAARLVLETNPEGVSTAERAELFQALGELLRELGERDGALAAFSEWARLAPNLPGPALSLLAMAQVDNDDKAAKLGLDALKSIGGDLEPYGMAARALELLRTDPNRPGPPPADRLFDADLLVKSLRDQVPSLRFGFLLEGMIREYRGDLEGALKSYRSAQKDDILSPALPKLIEVLIKLKRTAELDQLKREFTQEVEARQRPGLLAEFDRIAAAAALKLGDKDRAEYFASRLVDARRDNVSLRNTFAILLESNNEPGPAEETLKSLVKEKPNDPLAWLSLIGYQARKKSPADVAKTIAEARRDYHSERPELFLAQCYWFARDTEKANAAYKRAVEARPDDLVTLKSQIEYYENSNQGDLLEPVLRKVLKLDSSATWAGRMLAMILSARPDESAWNEAWALIAPGSPASGESPEDRLIRATLLARSPENSRRMEAVPAFISLANDLPISSPLAIDTRLRLCQAMMDIRHYADAWDTIRPIADDTARPNLAALVLAIEALSLSERPNEAEVRLDRLKSLAPKTPQIPLSTAWVKIARGQTAEAVALLESAYLEAANTPSAEAIATQALDRMLKLKDTETSLRLAKTIAQRWPAQATGLARVHLLRKEYDEALDACQIALDANSAREAIRYVVQASYARRTDSAFMSKVEALAEKALIKAPKDFHIQISLATIRHLQGRYEDELAFYRKALELNPNNMQFMNNMAWTLSEGLNNPKEAMKYIEEAIRREGEAPQHLDTRGVIEERLGQLDRAIADLEKSTKAEPSDTTYFHLSRAYWKANDQIASKRCRELAIKAGIKTEELDPTDRRDLEVVLGTP